MPAQYPWLELGKYLLISVIEDQRLIGFNNVMQIVARLLVLLSLLWVESVSADAEETANQLAYKREAVGGG